MLIFHLTNSYVRKAELEQDDNNDINLISEEYHEFNRLIESFSKIDRLEIIDKIKFWCKLYKKEEIKSAKILVSNDFYLLEGAINLLEELKLQFDINIISFSAKEIARQAFLGSKKNLPEYRQNARLTHINIEKEQIIMAFGDMHRLDKIIRIDFGIKKIVEYIISLQKNSQLENLQIFIKANLYQFLEQARFFGKPQIISFDENTNYLLLKALACETNRVGVDSIQQLTSKILSSNLNYLNNISTISRELINEYSANIILASFISEGLDAKACNLEKNIRLKGFLINELLDQDINRDQFIGHVNDWRRSAEEILLQFDPISISHAFQLSFLATRLFDSGHGWLHNWSEKERRLMFLSSFFYMSFKGNLLETNFYILFNHLLGINRDECQIIVSIIGLANLTDFIGQEKYLHALSVQHKQIAKKLGSILQLAKGFNITGRSAIQNLSFDNKKGETGKIILNVFPRLNPEPEMIQANILKKSFENQFEQKLFIQIYQTQNSSKNENSSSSSLEEFTSI